MYVIKSMYVFLVYYIVKCKLAEQPKILNIFKAHNLGYNDNTIIAPSPKKKYSCMVHFNFKLKNNSKACFGTLISKALVLTAAHCVHVKPFSENIYLTFANTPAHTEMVSSSPPIIHPGFTLIHNNESAINDLALIPLDQEVDFSQGASICTISYKDVPEGAECEIIEWRDINFTTSSGDDFQKDVIIRPLDATIVPVSMCIELTTEEKKYEELFYCTNSNKFGGTGIGVGGGPLMCNDYQVGVYIVANFDTENPDKIFAININLKHAKNWLEKYLEQKFRGVSAIHYCCSVSVVVSFINIMICQVFVILFRILFQ